MSMIMERHLIFLAKFFWCCLRIILCCSFSAPLDTTATESRGTPLAPIPACKQDFQRMKLTSFDKLIERTCSSIKNVRLCCESDLKATGNAGNLGMAPDAAYAISSSIFFGFTFY